MPDKNLSSQSARALPSFIGVFIKRLAEALAGAGVLALGYVVWMLHPWSH